MSNISAIKTQKVPTILVNCVEQGILETFATMFGTVQAIRCDNISEACNGISVIISFVGDIPCSLIVTLPQETACAMTNHFAGFEIPYESEDMIDAAGEIVNVLAGPISANLIAEGLQAHMSLPTVVRGLNVEMVLSGHTPVVRLHFECPQGPFRLKILTS